MEEGLSKILKEWEANDFISAVELNSGPGWISNLFAVTKKGSDKLRPVYDARAVNSRLQRVVETGDDLCQIIEQAAASRFVSCLDLKSGTPKHKDL